MYEVNGLVFDVKQRTEEGLMFSEPEIYAKLMEHKIEDDTIYLSFDEVVRLFRPSHKFGDRVIELQKDKGIKKFSLKKLRR